jgi:hypothetical protein
MNPFAESRGSLTQARARQQEGSAGNFDANGGKTDPGKVA